MNKTLTPEEQAVYEEVKREGAVYIPSRKAANYTQELADKRRILKRLVYMNLICIDVFYAAPDDEINQSSLVFYWPGDGKTPLEQCG